MSLLSRIPNSYRTQRRRDSDLPFRTQSSSQGEWETINLDIYMDDDIDEDDMQQRTSFELALQWL